MSPVRVSTVFLAVAVVGAAAAGSGSVQRPPIFCSEYDKKKNACTVASCSKLTGMSYCTYSDACSAYDKERKACVNDLCVLNAEKQYCVERSPPESSSLAQVFVEDGPSAVGRRVPGVPVTKGQQMQVSTNVGVRDFPRFLEGTHFHAVERVPANGRLRFQCEAPEACDFFVTVFSCGHCSGEVDGGLPALLTVTNGWEPRSCAPTMSVKSEEYKMKIFRVRVPTGTSSKATPWLPREARFVAVFSSTVPTEYCPVPVRPVGPFHPMRNCGDKCPVFVF